MAIVVHVHKSDAAGVKKSGASLLLRENDAPDSLPLFFFNRCFVPPKKVNQRVLKWTLNLGPTAIVPGLFSLHCYEHKPSQTICTMYVCKHRVIISIAGSDFSFSLLPTSEKNGHDFYSCRFIFNFESIKVWCGLVLVIRLWKAIPSTILYTARKLIVCCACFRSVELWLMFLLYSISIKIRPRLAKGYMILWSYTIYILKFRCTHHTRLLPSQQPCFTIFGCCTVCHAVLEAELCLA